MLLFCVAGAGLWKYDGCVAWPCHATHPGLKRMALSQSLPALLFRTLRTLADSRTKDAKYHGSNLTYKLDKKPMVFEVLGFGSMMVVLRGPAMQLTRNNTVNTTRNTSTFPANSQSKCASCAKSDISI